MPTCQGRKAEKVSADLLEISLLQLTMLDDGKRLRLHFETSRMSLAVWVSERESFVLILGYVVDKINDTALLIGTIHAHACNCVSYMHVF